MKIAIVGSRNYKSLYKVANFITALPSDSIIVSGGAKGVDGFAEKMADFLDLSKFIFRANWNKYGKSAGFIRNKDIICESDYVIAFWNNESKGTKHSIDLAIQMCKPVIVVYDE